MSRSKNNGGKFACQKIVRRAANKAARRYYFEEVDCTQQIVSLIEAGILPFQCVEVKTTVECVCPKPHRHGEVDWAL